MPPGQKGVLYVRGPNVMKGYYKKPDLTAQAITADGWLNTGDLAMLTYDGEIKIMGRAKETVVLMGGENVEPGPIEDTITESDYVDQVMVVGQDQKYLAALVVPNFESLSSYAQENGIPFGKPEDLLDNRGCVQADHGRDRLPGRSQAGVQTLRTHQQGQTAGQTVREGQRDDPHLEAEAECDLR